MADDLFGALVDVRRFVRDLLVLAGVGGFVVVAVILAGVIVEAMHGRPVVGVLPDLAALWLLSTAAIWLAWLDSLGLWGGGRRG